MDTDMFTLHKQLYVTTLHRISQHLFRTPDLVVPQVALFQHRAARFQGFGDGDGAVDADAIVIEIENGQHRKSDTCLYPGYAPFTPKRALPVGATHSALALGPFNWTTQVPSCLYSCS